MDTAPFRLRRLPLGARLSLTFLVLVNLGGYLASGLHMQEHHHNRDGRPEMSMADIEGVYHGVTTPSRLRELLVQGHPQEVEGAEPANSDDVSELLAWLDGEAVAENWSNIDFGEGFGSPEEITATACGSCHGSQVAATERAEPLLATWDHYKELAFENTVSPTDEAILLASTHAHAIAMATITLLICGLMYATRYGGKLKGLLSLLASGGLLFDLAAWWLARDSAGFVTLIVAGGLAHACAMGAMMLAVIADLWAPSRED
jgi:hypothetical protein